MKKPFETVVTAHAQTVLRACRFVVGPHDADDAWLVTIAHRKSIDIIRAQRRHAIPVDQVPARPSSIGLPEAENHDLWDAVKALPPKQRQAVAYHYLVGLPYAEVAKILGGTADAARRAAADGIAALRTTYPGTLSEEVPQ